MWRRKYLSWSASIRSKNPRTWDSVGSPIVEALNRDSHPLGGENRGTCHVCGLRAPSKTQLYEYLQNYPAISAPRPTVSRGFDLLFAFGHLMGQRICRFVTISSAGNCFVLPLMYVSPTRKQRHTSRAGLPFFV
jgi:hypothetical protein